MQNDTFFELFDDDTMTRLNATYTGALWRCLQCGRYFADRIPSILKALNDRSIRGCPYCSGGANPRPSIMLETFLTSGELSMFMGINSALGEGIAKIIPFES